MNMKAQNYSPAYSKYKVWNEKMKGIYGIFDSVTNECLYIGSSKAVNRRWNRHKTCINNLDYAKTWYPGQLYLYMQLAKHQNVTYSLIDQCDVSILRDLEKKYYNQYKPKYNKNKIK